MEGMSSVMAQRPGFGRFLWRYLKPWMHGPIFFGNEPPEESLRFMGWVCQDFQFPKILIVIINYLNIILIKKLIIILIVKLKL